MLLLLLELAFLFQVRKQGYASVVGKHTRSELFGRRIAIERRVNAHHLVPVAKKKAADRLSAAPALCTALLMHVDVPATVSVRTTHCQHFC